MQSDKYHTTFGTRPVPKGPNGIWPYDRELCREGRHVWLNPDGSFSFLPPKTLDRSAKTVTRIFAEQSEPNEAAAENASDAKVSEHFYQADSVAEVPKLSELPAETAAAIGALVFTN